MRHLLGLMDATSAVGGGDGEVARQGRTCLLGVGTVFHQKGVKSLCQANSLRPAGWAAAIAPSSPLFLPSDCCDQHHFKHV